MSRPAVCSVECFAARRRADASTVPCQAIARGEPKCALCREYENERRAADRQRRRAGRCVFCGNRLPELVS